MPRRTLAGALLLALLGTQGCFVARTTPVVPVPIHLVAPGGFLVRQLPVEGSATTGQCRLLEATGEFERLRGDTLVFRRVSDFRQPPGDALCRLEGAAYVMISQHPDLRAQSRHFSVGRTLIATSLVVLVSFIAISIAALSAFG